MAFCDDGQIHPIRKAWGEASGAQKPLTEMRLNVQKTIGLISK